MEKNWLIRTKSNHILGPVSKEKVVELYQNGSIKPDDEVCSGNGYWFYIREDDLVNRFLVGNEIQGFNPISEAKDVLTISGDLPCPVDDITLVGGIDLSMLRRSSDTTPEIMESDLAAEAKPVVVEDKLEQSGEAPIPKEAPIQTAIPISTRKNHPKKNKNQVKKKAENLPRQEASLKKQGWLRYATIAGFLLLLLLVYYRNSIRKYFFGDEFSYFSIIDSAIAQEEVPAKKKSF